ncbi:MAG: MerR family transcriptional regulator [Pedobacter sp.]|nr:MAG: MerR family transcriptional regulator [Pedobacter sp.]
MRYSISDLEQLTGVQTHTIRIWERRYNALKPMRSAGNTRFYDDQQLKRLLNIVSLSNTGLKISRVCALSESEMNALLEQEITTYHSSDSQYEYFISQLLKYGLAYDEIRFDELISVAITDFGLKDTYLNVIYPMLMRLGLMWQTDNICPGQEHFLSNMIRQKIYASIDQIVIEPNPASNWLLFLPEDEDHELGLLFANYLLKLSGQKVIYLGPKVPLDSVKDALDHIHVDHLLLFMVKTRTSADATTYLKELGNRFENHPVLVAGSSKMLGDQNMRGNLSWLSSIYDLEQIILKIQDAKK